MLQPISDKFAIHSLLGPFYWNRPGYLCPRLHLQVWLCSDCPDSLSIFYLSPVPCCRLGLHSSFRWRSAWLSCTCGPWRTRSKLKVPLITMFNLPPDYKVSHWLLSFLGPLRLVPSVPVNAHFVLSHCPHFYLVQQSDTDSYSTSLSY